MKTALRVSLPVLFSILTFGASAPLAFAALPENPTAPVLGEAGRFVILGSQAVTTDPVSSVSDGDIGIIDIARTGITGFTPTGPAGDFTTLTNGTSYAPNDANPAPFPYPLHFATLPVGDPWTTTAAMIDQVRTDLGIAYTFLATDPNPTAPTQASPTELGGLTLTRGVYYSAANVAISTPLHLDAQGDPNSVFIFSTDSNLTTGATGNIFLDNGAQAKNVYWRVAGITTIAAGTNFSGNVVNWAQVNVLAGANVTGRLFSANEQVTLISNIVAAPTATPPTTGPVFIDANHNGNLDSGELFFNTIQGAVNTASAGDTVFVTAGTYNEKVLINVNNLTLKGAGDTTIINGGVDVTGDTVVIENTKIINSHSHDGGVNDYGVHMIAGKALTLEAVTVDVLHDAISMTGDSTTNDTALTINHSTIKGYGALVISGAINSAGTQSAVVTIHDSNLTGTTQYSGSFDDFSVIGMSDTSNVMVNFTGTSSVTNEYTGGAQSKERLIAFYSANNNSVTGTPTYTNAANSTVNTNALFVSAYGPYTNTVEGQVVARYVYNTTTFEAALASASTTPIVVGRYETTYDVTPTPIETTGDNTLKTGVTLLIEDHNIVTIMLGTTLVNNGTILTESNVTFTNNGTMSGVGTMGTASVSTVEVQTSTDTLLSGTGGGVTMDVNIASSTTVTGDASWDGTISGPVSTTATVAVSGYDTTVTSAFTVGSNDSDLTLDKAVKLTFADQAGAHVGRYNHAGTFTEITAICAANDQATGDALAADASCKIDALPDLIVWTKHFSTFVTYTQSPTPPPASSGGGGGSNGPTYTYSVSINDAAANTTSTSVTLTLSTTANVNQMQISNTSDFSTATWITFQSTYSWTLTSDLGNKTVYVRYANNNTWVGNAEDSIALAAMPAIPAVPGVSPATPASPAQGQVLGAAVYNFTKALAVGVRSDEVTELQKFLIAEGLLKIDAPTGYFGQLTRTAVIAFQKARGIAQAGVVGPLTRAELNKGVVATAKTSTGSKLNTLQASAVIGFLQAFGADASIVANVKAALGI